MSTARELLKETAPEIESLRGKVSIPESFNDTSFFNKMKLSGYIVDRIRSISANNEVISEYTNPKEKLGGMLVGFYVNNWVRKQNALNAQIAALCEEFETLCARRYELNQKINEATERLNSISKEEKES